MKQLLFCLSMMGVCWSLPVIAQASAIERFRIECPYDDFLNEEITIEIQVLANSVVLVDGRFSGETLNYPFSVTAERFQRSLDPQTGGLTQLSFEGLDQSGLPLGFDFQFSTPFGSGIGHSTSEVIGNRVFICSQSSTLL